jgi:hypothetical protein
MGLVGKKLIKLFISLLKQVVGLIISAGSHSMHFIV